MVHLEGTSFASTEPTFIQSPCKKKSSIVAEISNRSAGQARTTGSLGLTDEHGLA